jgi:hypothetical protein
MAAAFLYSEKGLLTPQAIQLALDLVNRKKTKDQLIDSGFKRDAFFDDKNELPTWFLDDEMRHFREHVPVTKEAVKILRDKMRALDARPIKKIAEAKGRKKLRTLRRIEKAQSKANTVNETSDLTEKEKSLEITKLMSRMHKTPKTKSDIKIVVAKGANRGQKGRPRGVKGRYKVRSLLFFFCARSFHSSHHVNCIICCRGLVHSTNVLAFLDGRRQRKKRIKSTEEEGTGFFKEETKVINYLIEQIHRVRGLYLLYEFLFLSIYYSSKVF